MTESTAVAKNGKNTDHIYDSQGGEQYNARIDQDNRSQVVIRLQSATGGPMGAFSQGSTTSDRASGGKTLDQQVSELTQSHITKPSPLPLWDMPQMGRCLFHHVLHV